MTWDREDEADLAYEVWRRGGNPDSVTGDEIDRIRSRGFDPTPEDFLPRYDYDMEDSNDTP